MTMLVEVPRLVPGVIMVLARLFRRVAMSVLIEITGLVTWVIVVLAGDFLGRLVAVPAFVEVPRGMAGMVVMCAGFFVWHDDLPSRSL